MKNEEQEKQRIVVFSNQVFAYSGLEVGILFLPSHVHFDFIRNCRFDHFFAIRFFGANRVLNFTVTKKSVFEIHQ